MIRSQGYLDLDLYYKELKEKNNLSDKDLYDKCIIKNSELSKNHFWLTIEGENYYFKGTSFKTVNELICYELATIMNIEVTFYDLAVYKDSFGVISKNYKKDNCNYVSGLDILKEYYENNLNVLVEMGFDKDANLNEEIPYHVQMNNLEII